MKPARTPRPRSCWCGNTTLEDFDADYLRCSHCETIVRRHAPTTDITRVRNDTTDFYGKTYFGKYVTDLGYPDLTARARADLPERGLHWLRAILKYKLPPGKALELGSAHGGLVALLRWAGFDARGLELSPTIVKLARRTFDVPTLLGPVEDQRIASRSLSFVALMDVLEHLPDPVATMKHCLRLLQRDGILVIQTPRYPEGKSHAQLVAGNDRFLEQLKPQEHLWLFSEKSVRELFRQLGAHHIAFEPAIFAHYDMFFVVSRQPLKPVASTDITRALTRTPSSRLIQCLLDADDRLHQLDARFQESEADRAARLNVIHEQGRRTVELEAEVHRCLQEIQRITGESEQSAHAHAEENRQLAGKLTELDTLTTAEINALKTELERRQASLAERAQLQAETHRQRDEIDSLSQKLRDAETAFTTEKTELTARLDKILGELDTVVADRTRLSAEIDRQLGEMHRLQSRIEELQRANESLKRDLQTVGDENRNLASRLETQARALDGAVKSLEAARVRVKELHEQLMAVDARWATRLLKATGLWPRE